MSNGGTATANAPSAIDPEAVSRLGRSQRPVARVEAQSVLHCPECGAANRIARRRNAVAWCTGCGADLFHGRVLDLTLENLDAFLRASRLPALVMFWAPWCAPCERLGMLVERVAAMFETRMRFARVNVEEETSLAARYRVRGIPTLLLFRNGREIARRIGGNLNEHGFIRWLAH